MRARLLALFALGLGSAPVVSGQGENLTTAQANCNGHAANIDPHGPPSGEKRMIRGGSWFFDANSARCGLRYTHAPEDRGFSLGFRVAADRPR